VWRDKGEYDKSISDLNESNRLDLKDAYPHWGLGWIYATCPAACYRDGAKAVENARKTCELTQWKEPGVFETLAAAYAENGEFSEAVKWQEKAIELASANDKADLRSRLDLYKSRKPYREKPKN
jgi:tetratricopeptide (TPR) repeat protein